MRSGGLASRSLASSTVKRHASLLYPCAYRASAQAKRICKKEQMVVFKPHSPSLLKPLAARILQTQLTINFSSRCSQSPIFPSSAIRYQRITQKTLKPKLTDSNYFHASPFQLLAHTDTSSKYILRLLQERDTVYLDYLWLSREFLLT